MDTTIENDVKSNNCLPKPRTSKKCLDFSDETCLKIELNENMPNNGSVPDKPVDKNEELKEGDKCLAMIHTPKVGQMHFSFIIYVTYLKSVFVYLTIKCA